MPQTLARQLLWCSAIAQTVAHGTLKRQCRKKQDGSKHRATQWTMLITSDSVTTVGQQDEPRLGQQGHLLSQPLTNTTTIHMHIDVISQQRIAHQLRALNRLCDVTSSSTATEIVKRLPYVQFAWIPGSADIWTHSKAKPWTTADGTQHAHSVAVGLTGTSAYIRHDTP
jgi:hypothetical protein